MLGLPIPVGLIDLFLSTIGTDAPYLYLGFDGIAEFPDLGWHAQRIQLAALEIPSRTAANADEMMVLLHIPVEALAFPAGTECGYHAQVRQGPEGSIDSIQGYGREARFQARVDRLGIRMISAQGYFLEYLEPLMGELEAPIFCGGFQGLEPGLQDCFLV